MSTSLCLTSYGRFLLISRVVSGCRKRKEGSRQRWKETSKDNSSLVPSPQRSVFAAAPRPLAAHLSKASCCVLTVCVAGHYTRRTLSCHRFARKASTLTANGVCGLIDSPVVPFSPCERDRPTQEASLTLFTCVPAELLILSSYSLFPNVSRQRRSAAFYFSSSSTSLSCYLR